jgi:hypothetical protein
MKKMSAIVMSLLMVGVYADFSSAQEEEAPRRPRAQREGDAPRRPGAQGERRPGAEGRRPGAPGAEGRRPGGPGNFMARLPIFAALDTDGDGILSEEEIANATASLKKLDKNGDGKLD